MVKHKLVAIDEFIETNQQVSQIKCGNYSQLIDMQVSGAIGIKETIALCLYLGACLVDAYFCHLS